MEKTARRNIMTIYEDWRIFRKILKRDLALCEIKRRRRPTSRWEIAPRMIYMHMHDLHGGVDRT